MATNTYSSVCTMKDSRHSTHINSFDPLTLLVCIIIILIYECGNCARERLSYSLKIIHLENYGFEEGMNGINLFSNLQKNCEKGVMIIHICLTWIGQLLTFCHIWFFFPLSGCTFLSKSFEICRHRDLSPLLQHVFPKNKSIVFHNHNARSHSGNFTVIIFYYLIYSSYSNFPNCPSNVLYIFKKKSTLQSRCIELCLFSLL